MTEHDHVRPADRAHPGSHTATYAGSGVSIVAGDEAVEQMRPYTEKTHRSEVLGGIGGFASLFKLNQHKYRDPVLASSTDGVGTKVAIAQAMDKHDTIGIDLVAMVVDDLVVCGAEPLFLQDYIACGRVDPAKIADIVSGIADGCVQAGCALVGGETAEHPGLMAPEDYDLAATGVGVVEQDNILGPTASGPAMWCWACSLRACTPTGSRSSGTSCWTSPGSPWRAKSKSSVGPWAPNCWSPAGSTPRCACRSPARPAVHTFAHITGGGLAGNLARVIPNGLHARLDRGAWTPLQVFGYIAGHGRVEREEMEKAFNMGIGMVAVLPADDVDRAMAVLTGRPRALLRPGDRRDRFG